MQIHMYDQWKCPKTDSDLDTPWCVEDRRDLLLNFESPVTDLLLSNLKSPVTDGITDISNSPDWYYLVFFSPTLYFWQVQSTSTMWFWGEEWAGN